MFPVLPGEHVMKWLQGTENAFSCVHYLYLRSLCIMSSLEPGSPPTLYRIRNKKGESLEDFDHVLDMVGLGLQDHTSIEQC